MWLIAESRGVSHVLLWTAVLAISLMLVRLRWQQGRRARWAGERKSALVSPAPVHLPRAVETRDIARDSRGAVYGDKDTLANLIREARAQASRLEQAVAAARSTGSSLNEAAAQDSADRAAIDVNGWPPEAAAGKEAIQLVDPIRRGNANQSSRQTRQREVYALADNGLDLQQIAQRSGVPLGEVQLMLALRDPGAA